MGSELGMLKTALVFAVGLCFVRGHGPSFDRMRADQPGVIDVHYASGLTLRCSVTRNLTPSTPSYIGGNRLGKSKRMTGNLDEAWPKPCGWSRAPGGVYQCKGFHHHGPEVMVATRLEAVGRVSSTGCPPMDKHTRPPVITSWFSNILIQAGETAHLACDLLEPNEGRNKSVEWRDSNNRKIRTGGRYELTSTDLFIHNVGLEDMGAFTCSAWNDFGMDGVVTTLCPLSQSYDAVYASCYN